VQTRIAAIRKHFIVRADEKLTAFLELESAIPFQKLEAQRSTVAERCP
jgi:hypothetical protein